MTPSIGAANKSVPRPLLSSETNLKKAGSIASHPRKPTPCASLSELDANAQGSSRLYLLTAPGASLQLLQHAYGFLGNDLVGARPEGAGLHFVTALGIG